MTNENLLESLIETVVRETIEEELVFEGMKTKMNVKINGKVFPFGSREHVRDLKAVLMGLEKLRDCYAKGSANRHVYANGCGKLRKLIQKMVLNLQNNGKPKLAPAPPPPVVKKQQKSPAAAEPEVSADSEESEKDEVTEDAAFSNFNPNKIYNDSGNKSIREI